MTMSGAAHCKRENKNRMPSLNWLIESLFNQNQRKYYFWAMKWETTYSIPCVYLYPMLRPCMCGVSAFRVTSHAKQTIRNCATTLVNGQISFSIFFFAFYFQHSKRFDLTFNLRLWMNILTINKFWLMSNFKVSIKLENWIKQVDSIVPQRPITIKATLRLIN